MRKLHTAVRIGALGALFVLICAVYLVILVNVQITGQDYYDIIKEETTTRYVKIAAKRGEIYDTNGKALVINTQIYDIRRTPSTRSFSTCFPPSKKAAASTPRSR